MSCGTHSAHPGQALARVLASRGLTVSLDQAAELTFLLLDLVVAGVLVPAAVHQDAGRPSPQDSSDRRPVVRRGSGPTVYNMGPSVHGSAGDRP